MTTTAWRHRFLMKLLCKTITREFFDEGNVFGFRRISNCFCGDCKNPALLKEQKEKK